MMLRQKLPPCQGMLLVLLPHIQQHFPCFLLQREVQFRWIYRFGKLVSLDV
jgi:hypothetical protein